MTLASSLTLLMEVCNFVIYVCMKRTVCTVQCALLLPVLFLIFDYSSVFESTLLYHIVEQITFSSLIILYNQPKVHNVK